MEKKQSVCPKCENIFYEVDEFRVAGGGLAKLFDIQNKRFKTISCKKCGYTEIYKAQSSDGLDILDFFMGQKLFYLNKKRDGQFHLFFLLLIKLFNDITNVFVSFLVQGELSRIFKE